MNTRALTPALLLCACAAAHAAAPPADVPPDSLLPATSIAYARWGGHTAHAKAYKRSAFGAALDGELGRSARSLWGRAESAMMLSLVGDKLLGGAAPADLRRRRGLVNALAAVPSILARTGVSAAFEASAVPPAGDLIGRLGKMAFGGAGPEALTPHAQFTAVIPGARDIPEALKAAEALSVFAEGEGGKRVTVSGRAVTVFPLTRRSRQYNPIKALSALEDPAAGRVEATEGLGSAAWWMEGRHFVLVWMPGDPLTAVRRVIAGGEGITGRPLYKAMDGKTTFEVTTRGFIDGSAITSNLRWLRMLAPGPVEALEHTGLLDIKALRFWEGLEGEASRSLWEADIASERRGGAKLLINKALDRKALPPIPDDCARWTAARLDPMGVYDLILTAAASSDPGPPSPPSLFGGSAFARARERAKQRMDDAVGIDIEDLFASMGDTLLAHASWGDGLSVLGQTVAVSARDERKLARLADALMGKAAAMSGGTFQLRKKTFHGATIRELRAGRFGPPFTLSYTVHKGWLAVGLNQQTVQGFVLRGAGKLPAWKPDARTAKALAAVPADAGLVQVIDPRSSVNVLLTTAPLYISSFRQLSGEESALDSADVPHAGAVTKHLFPNVGWTSFDGKTWRMESRGSLWLPMQETGLELFFFVAGRFAF